jgi:hypothetical protein
MIQTLPPIELPYSPHPTQEIVHQSKAKWKVLECGRGWGKDRLGHAEVYRRYAEWYNDPFPEYLMPALNFMILGPTFGAVTQNWIELKEFSRPLGDAGLVKQIKEDEKKVILYLPNDNECIIEVCSADRPESLLGRGLDLLHVTECDDISDIVFNSYVRPMLRRADRKGYAIFAGTPRREESWMSTLAKEGQKGNGEIEYFHFTSFDNPYADHEAILRDMETMPNYIARMEYYAERMADVQSAFQNISACIQGIPEQPIENHQYVVGIDLGRSIDYTVQIAMDKATRRAVAFERFDDKSWEVQERKMVEFCKKWNNPLVIMDTSNVGMAIYQYMGKQGFRTKGINLHSGIEKKRILDNLALAMEKETVHFPKDFKVLIKELSIYKRIAANKWGQPIDNIKFRAPIGQHDDAVVALALALDGCPRPGAWDTSIKLAQPSIRFA